MITGLLWVQAPGGGGGGRRTKETGLNLSNKRLQEDGDITLPLSLFTKYQMGIGQLVVGYFEPPVTFL